MVRHISRRIFLSLPLSTPLKPYDPRLILKRTHPFNQQMASQQIQTHRENAEIFTGEALCKEKSRDLLAKFSLPKGLIPLTDVTEVGHNASTGFVWVRRKKKTTHLFRSIGRKVSYDCEVTAFVEDRRMRNLTGVKSKELLIWVTISDICASESGKITFGTPAGLSRTFPATAFEEED